MKTVVNEAYAKVKSDTGGKNADYIPYLAEVDSGLFGVAVNVVFRALERRVLSWHTSVRLEAVA